MKLDEILNKKIDYEVTRAENMDFHTEAQIGDRVIHFACETENGVDWEATFSEKVKGQNSSYVRTGSGNEFEVFSMVKDSLLEFIQRYQPESIMFTADKDVNDTTRADLYDRLVKRFKVRGYKYERKVRLSKDDFILRRIDTD